MDIKSKSGGVSSSSVSTHLDCDDLRVYAFFCIPAEVEGIVFSMSIRFSVSRSEAIN